MEANLENEMEYLLYYLCKRPTYAIKTPIHFNFIVPDTLTYK